MEKFKNGDWVVILGDSFFNGVYQFMWCGGFSFISVNSSLVFLDYSSIIDHANPEEIASGRRLRND